MNAIPRTPVRKVSLCAGVAGLLALAVPLALGPGSATIPSRLLAIAAAALALTDLGRRGRQLLRGGLGWGLALAALGAVTLGAAWSTVAAAQLGLAGFGLLLCAGGAALTTLALARLAVEGEDEGRRTPWQVLARGTQRGATWSRRFTLLAPVLAGLTGMLLGLRLVVAQVAQDAETTTNPGIWVIGTIAVVICAGGPGWALRSLQPRTGASASRAAFDRQHVAAHLHDSVLQTLALIGRSTDDPARMAALARRQERSLRAWLAGRDETSVTTLAAAVRHAAHEVEDEQPGTTIDVAVVGDARLDDAARAMVAAAREAMRNAARHAGGTVRVLVEVENAGARSVHVRDTGTGFDPAAVAPERRGIRDAIVGRMVHAGGSATIESERDGALVTLRLPEPRGHEGGTE